MKNKYIEVVKRWQAGEVFSVEALTANAEAANAAWLAARAAYVAADVADAAAAAKAAAAWLAYAAAAADADAADTDRLIKRYEELTNDKSTKGNETEAWA